MAHAFCGCCLANTRVAKNRYKSVFYDLSYDFPHVAGPSDQIIDSGHAELEHRSFSLANILDLSWIELAQRLAVQGILPLVRLPLHDFLIKLLLGLLRNGIIVVDISDQDKLMKLIFDLIVIGCQYAFSCHVESLTNGFGLTVQNTVKGFGKCYLSLV